MYLCVYVYMSVSASFLIIIWFTYVYGIQLTYSESATLTYKILYLQYI